MSRFSKFDGTDKPSQSIIDDCVHCGFCLSACPTYVETGNELDSPRGRIYLIKSVMEEKIPLGNSVVEHLDKCLGCLACETACPSGVKYRFLIESSRAQIERNYRRSLSDKLYRGFIFKLIPYQKKLGMFLPILYLYNKTGIRKLFAATGILRKISKKLYRMEQMIPSVDNIKIKKYPEVIPSRDETRYKVALLTGCVQNVFFSKTNTATIEVLTKLGCEVIVPTDQTCCGALSNHSGRLEEGREFARKLIDTFISLDIDYLIVNSAGCGSSIKEYGELLANDSEYSERAGKLSGKTRDIIEFIDEIGIKGNLKTMNLKVTYQDACHISHGQSIRTAPRNILSQIPGLQLIEMNESDHCCGSAGIYNLVQPEMAEKILFRKISNIKETGSDMLVAGNPGCLLQIQKGIRENRLKIKTAHPIELLNKALN
ncbi:MAG: (Fe-S)-binding protein [Thermodesulfobacteriota bacterium]